LFSREKLGNWVEGRVGEIGELGRQVGELGERVVCLGSEEEEEEEEQEEEKESLGEELRRGRKGGRTTRSRVEID
jgi:hypothetical protein